MLLHIEGCRMMSARVDEGQNETALALELDLGLMAKSTSPSRQLPSQPVSEMLAGNVRREGPAVTEYS